MNKGMLSLVSATRLHLLRMEHTIWRFLFPQFGGPSGLQPAIAGGWHPALMDNGGDSEHHEEEEEEQRETGGLMGDHVLRMAVPKKKSSHNRIARRQLHKFLPQITHHVECSKCGSPRLLHHLCIGCFWKEHKQAKRRLGILPIDPARARADDN